MSTTYEIRNNPQYNSTEVYFDGKPSEEIRNALKALRFRWHGIKKCWYGFATDFEISRAINNATPDEEQTTTTVYSDGYLGGGAVFGGKSHLHLYGQELKKAIAEDIKKAGIKGVTLAMRRDTIYATIKTTPEDIRPFEDFYKDFSISGSCYWIDYFDEDKKVKNIHRDKFYDLEQSEREYIRRGAAELEYQKEVLSECSLNEYHLDKYKTFSDKGMKKIQAIQNIILAYRFDESNAMVDYFHTNFYYYLITKPTATKEV